MSGYAIRSAYAVAPTRADIDRLQVELAKLPQARVETEHRFADGMYLREYTQPPDTLVVSKIHKRENFFVVTKGSAWIGGDGETAEVKAGDIIITKAGQGCEQRRVRRSRWEEAGRMEMQSGNVASRRRHGGPSGKEAGWMPWHGRRPLWRYGGMAVWRDGGMAGCAFTSKLNLSGGCLRIFTSNSLHRMKRI